MAKLEDHYPVEAAAALLGISVERMQKLIDQNLVDVVEHENAVMVPKTEIARLFDKVTDDDEDPNKASVKEKSPGSVQYSSKMADEGDPNLIVVKDEELINLHDQRDRCRMRLQNLNNKIERLKYQMALYKAIEQGKNAEFWKRAQALYANQLAFEKVHVSEKRGEQLVIIKDSAKGGPSGDVQAMIAKVEAADHIPEPIKRIIIEALKHGKQPPPGLLGSLGIT